MPLSRALLYIFLTTVATSGSGTLGWLYYLHLQHARAHDERFLITAIVQTGPDRQQLPTAYLAELLELSADRNAYLYRFDCRKAVRNLCASALIKEARVSRLRPNALYVDYVARQPIGYLADYENIALDRDAVPFPSTPFLTPKRLPEIVTGGEEPLYWDTPLQSPQVRLALACLRLLMADFDFLPEQIARIDTSQAYAESCGRQEVVLFLHEDEGECAIRLHPQYIAAQLENYMRLRNVGTDLEPIHLVDMRIPQLAFVE